MREGDQPAMLKFAALCALTVSFLLSSTLQLNANPRPGSTNDFDKGWRFHLGDVARGQDPGLADSQWRALDLPHGWGFGGEVSEKQTATPGRGALPRAGDWISKHVPPPPAPTRRTGC